MSKKLRWTEDQSALPAFKEFGIKYEEAEIDAKDIDWEASKSNHARILGQPIDENLVEDYALAMENGDAFPKPVVFKSGKKYTIAGGNHRAAAAEIYGAETISVYIAMTNDEYIRDMLPRVLNRRCGRRTGKDEAYQHALYAISKYGLKIGEAARLCGVSEKALSNKITINGTRTALVSLGVQAQLMTDESMRLLATLNDNDNVLSATARVIQQSKMTGKEAADVVRRVKAERTEAQRVAVVAEYEKRLGTKGVKQEAVKHRQIVRSKFLNALTRFEAIIAKAKALSRLQITEPEEKADVSRRLTGVGSKCVSLARG